ncbi:hypothetical protein KIN20_007884 [Parelaphostrongylus tenuis]|uniref:Uncharacterized protein n=2 Tax=Parelaphostrongylus tenuis TaxID=148309 RepID=A0AAD5M407_PARTN|nr:hypothetical protein KIN20_007884 [Parelaphostrongylus tenuis]
MGQQQAPSLANALMSKVEAPMVTIGLLLLLFVASSVSQTCDREREVRYHYGSKTRDLPYMVKERLKAFNLKPFTSVKLVQVWPDNSNLVNSRFDMEVDKGEVIHCDINL